ncbi:MAG: site-2 protease family protein [Verrucomicrobiota bacterium]
MTPDLTDGLKWYLAFVVSTTAHEASHAWSALKLGDDTAHRGGQVTLDPTPHIRRSPIGMVVVPILSFLLGGWMIGWASAPYNPQWAAQYPRRAALMSLAGPASNFLLVVLAAVLIRAGMSGQVLEAPAQIASSQVTMATAPGIYPFFARMLSIFFSLNLLLCIFNLIPLPPLDGSGILLLFLPGDSAARWFQAVRTPAFNTIGLVVSWRILDAVFPSVQLFAVNLLYPGMEYH